MDSRIAEKLAGERGDKFYYDAVRGVWILQRPCGERLTASAMVMEAMSEMDFRLLFLEA